jgi:hypothetical protein
MVVFLLSAMPLLAQDTPIGPEGTQVATQATPAAAVNTDALRNAAQNPVASLISVPLQENFNFNTGPADRTQNVLNIQPVVPFSVSKDWNLIVRWIMPVVYQPIAVAQVSGPPAQTTGVYGLGDMNPSFFSGAEKEQDNLGHRSDGGIANGNEYDLFGAGETQHGAVGVVLVPPHWTIGALANNVWSVAGHSNRDKPAVNQFLLQWFVNYNMKKGWYLTTSPIVTANWRAPATTCGRCRSAEEWEEL